MLYSHNQLPIGTQPALLRHLCQRFTHHLNVWPMFANVKLVEALIANVVSHIFDDEQNGRCRICLNCPSLNHALAQTGKRLIGRQLYANRDRRILDEEHGNGSNYLVKDHSSLAIIFATKGAIQIYTIHPNISIAVDVLTSFTFASWPSSRKM